MELSTLCTFNRYKSTPRKRNDIRWSIHLNINKYLMQKQFSWKYIKYLWMKSSLKWLYKLFLFITFTKGTIITNNFLSAVHVCHMHTKNGERGGGSNKQTDLFSYSNRKKNKNVTISIDVIIRKCIFCSQ